MKQYKPSPTTEKVMHFLNVSHVSTEALLFAVLVRQDNDGNEFDMISKALRREVLAQLIESLK